MKHTKIYPFCLQLQYKHHYSDYWHNDGEFIHFRVIKTGGSSEYLN